MANWDKTYFHKSKISELMGPPDYPIIDIQQEFDVKVKVGKFFERVSESLSFCV